MGSDRGAMRRGFAATVLAVAIFAFAGRPARAQQGYQKPPKAILDVLNAPLTPQVSVNRSRDVALLFTPALYPPIAELAQPMLRLAGLRINPANNGPHSPPRYTNLAIKRLADGAEKRVALPGDAYFGALMWSPDGKRFIFTRMAASAWSSGSATRKLPRPARSPAWR